MAQFNLTLSCSNRPGIVARVAGHLFERGCDILDAQQYEDQTVDRFFMRVAFRRSGATDIKFLQDGFAPVAASLNMVWSLRSSTERRRVALLVSKADHCLVDLLYRWRIGELEMDPAVIISNHPATCFSHLDFMGIPFHSVADAAGTKALQEEQILDHIERYRVELVVLARYMQVLSDALASRLSGTCINIHHSFLPGFKGARPYHQAHEYGVKLIGATAHYVTAQLDEGPIIVQDVEHISHRDSPRDLVRKGRDIERRVLAKALRLHLEDRVLCNGRKTVIFDS